MDESSTIIDPSSNDESKMTILTTNFRVAISNIYAGKCSFLSSECAAKALANANILKKSNPTSSSSNFDLQSLARKIDRLRSSVCPRCKIHHYDSSRMDDSTRSLSWKSRSSTDRGGGKFRKSRNRGDGGKRSSKLIVTCTNCRSTKAIDASGDRTARFKVKVGGIKGVDVEPIRTSTIYSTPIGRRASSKTTSSSIVTPGGNISSSSVKKPKSKLEKLLAREEMNRNNRDKSISSGGLASFLESL